MRTDLVGWLAGAVVRILGQMLALWLEALLETGLGGQFAARLGGVFGCSFGRFTDWS